MNNEAQIQAITEKVQALISPDADVFLVDIRIKPTNNIKVYLDGDQGLSIERLVHFNRKLYKQLEEGAMFPGGDFSLEVSSPGVDEPLKLHRQYVKNCGRFVEVILNDGTQKEGKMLSVSDTSVTIEETKGKGKKLEVLTHSIELKDIKTTKIQIKF